MKEDHKIKKIREDFSELRESADSHKAPVYLNNSLNYLMPDSILKRVREESAQFKEGDDLSPLLEDLRRKIQLFLGAALPEEIVFTKSSSHAAQLLAGELSKWMKEGDEVILSPHEYLSTDKAWEEVADKTGIKIVRPSLQQGKLLDIEEYQSLFSDRTKVVCLNSLSSYTGIKSDLKPLIEMAHKAGAVVIIDAVQTAPRFSIDVQDLDADFLYFSGYRFLGIRGIGALYARKELLDRMHLCRSEAEPTNVPVILSLDAGLDYTQYKIGLEWIQEHEKMLMRYAKERLESIPGLDILDYSDDHRVFLIFNVKGFTADLLQQILLKKGIFIGLKEKSVTSNKEVCFAFALAPDRIVDFYQVQSYLRVVLALYNNKSDIDRLVEEIKRAQLDYTV